MEEPLGQSSGTTGQAKAPDTGELRIETSADQTASHEAAFMVAQGRVFEEYNAFKDAQIVRRQKAGGASDGKPPGPPVMSPDGGTAVVANMPPAQSVDNYAGLKSSIADGGNQTSQQPAIDSSHQTKKESPTIPAATGNASAEKTGPGKENPSVASVFLDTEKQGNNSASQPPPVNSTVPDDSKTTDSISSQNPKDNSTTASGVGVPTVAEKPGKKPTGDDGTAAASASSPTKIVNSLKTTTEQQAVTSTVSNAASSGTKPAETVKVIGSDKNTSTPIRSADQGVAPSIMPPAMSANDYGSYESGLVPQIELTEVAATAGASAPSPAEEAKGDGSSNLNSASAVTPSAKTIPSEGPAKLKGESTAPTSSSTAVATEIPANSNVDSRVTQPLDAGTVIDDSVKQNDDTAAVTSSESTLAATDPEKQSIDSMAVQQSAEAATTTYTAVKPNDNPLTAAQQSEVSTATTTLQR